MTPFEFTIAAPPSDEQFRDIADELFTSLCKQTGLDLIRRSTYIEPRSWITTKLRSHVIHGHVIDVVLQGVLSYSLREGPPSIQSVLLAFSKGRRLRVGRETILTSDFIADDTGGHWEDFAWEPDFYDEWECEELPAL